jgi:hypothetical protein
MTSLLNGKTVKEVLPVAGVLNPDMLLLLFPVTKGKAEEEEAMCPQRHHSCKLQVDVPPKFQSQNTYVLAHKQSFGNKKDFYHKHTQICICESQTQKEFWDCSNVNYTPPTNYILTLIKPFSSV